MSIPLNIIEEPHILFRLHVDLHYTVDDRNQVPGIGLALDTLHH